MSRDGPALPLVIDPVLSYSTYLGGSSNDIPHAIAVLLMFGLTTAATAQDCASIAAQAPAGVALKAEALADSPAIAAVGNAPAMPALKAHCKLSGQMRERVGMSEKGEPRKFYIGFELRLPADWNGRLLYQGGGGNDGVVRTAMSRLAADGWLERNKVGRNSFYRLVQRERLTFDIATKHIYGPPASDWTGRFELLLIANGGDRDAAREALKNAGFGSPLPGVWVAPSGVPVPDEAARAREVN